MMNQHTGHPTAEQFYRIPPALAGVPGDDLTAGEDHPAAAGQRADTGERDFPYRNISARAFERRLSLADFGEIRRTFETERINAIMMPRTAESATQKTFLPRRSGEPRFGPQQYYYPASKTGVMPSWALALATPT
jgi:hypothetical protein